MCIRDSIRPEPDARRLGVRLKLNAVRQAVDGKHVLVVDDSIVRGTTGARLVRLLREAGAKSVGLMIASPPVTHRCYYGIGTNLTGDELLAASNGISSVLEMTGADSLHYLSREGLLEAMKNAGAQDTGFCLGCFGGCYPVIPGKSAAGPQPDNSDTQGKPEKGKAGEKVRATYSASGVDIDRGMEAVEMCIRDRIYSMVRETTGMTTVESQGLSARTHLLLNGACTASKPFSKMCIRDRIWEMLFPIYMVKPCKKGNRLKIF